MKMITLTLITCLFCASLGAPPSPAITIVGVDAIHPYEALWNATCYVETRFDTMAIGDKNLKKHSYGIAQIRQSRLDDFNKQTGLNYTTRDMFSPVKSKEVFMFYASGSDMECTARLWNGGPDGMDKTSTVTYWKLIQSQL
jgi:hypothetical protein